MNRDVILKGIVAVVVAAGIALVGWRFLHRRTQNRADDADRRQRIASLAAEHNAVTNWQSRFDEEGMKLEDGHRSVYTADIREAVLRTNGQPLLVIGYVFEVTKDGDTATLGVTAYEYPDMNFVLRCTTTQADLVLKQPTDDGEFFAVIANVISVSRPGFETDAWVEEDEDDVYAEVIVEPGDQYMLHGRCLDLMYLGEYDPD